MNPDHGVFEWCVPCKARTRHLKTACVICKSKDEKDVADALERIRLAEGADGLQESTYDPFQGDIFEAGNGEDNIRRSDR